MAETAISRFKTFFREYLLSRKHRWIDVELITKILLKTVTP